MARASRISRKLGLVLFWACIAVAAVMIITLFLYNPQDKRFPATAVTLVVLGLMTGGTCYGLGRAFAWFFSRKD